MPNDPPNDPPGAGATTGAAPPGEFDPRPYLSKLKGDDYLEVKWRLLWLRTTQPAARIETELMAHEGQHAIFRAWVKLPDTTDPSTGELIATGGSATGWGSEAPNDFRDYIEKAESATC
jgi:hypothetical protein